jgi:hypothetical protein
MTSVYPKFVENAESSVIRRRALADRGFSNPVASSKTVLSATIQSQRPPLVEARTRKLTSPFGICESILPDDRELLKRQ